MPVDIPTFRERIYDDITRTIGHTPLVRLPCLIHAEML
jgi:hypothetical protein